MLRKLFSLTCLLTGLALLAGSTPRAAAQDDVSWLLQQINALRASVGVPGFSLNAQLSAAATQHSAYMATTCDVSHTESNGSTPADRARANGYGGSRVGENIYGGSIAKATDAWAFWLNSAIHYQGMTSGMYNEVGIGVSSGPCGNYYTLDFGYRSDLAAPPAAAVPLDAGGGQSAAPVADSSGASSAAAAPPPTQAPYVPPPPSRTPTATIDTLTPSPTWTLTPTYTPSPTGTIDVPTSTPLVLPTVPALVGFAPSETMLPVETPTPTLTPSPTQSPTAVPTIQPQKSEPEKKMQTRDLIPFAVVGQIVLIGMAGFYYFRHSK